MQALHTNYSGDATWWPNNVVIRSPHYQLPQPSPDLEFILYEASSPTTMAEQSLRLSVTMQPNPSDVAPASLLYMCPMAYVLYIRRGTQGLISPLDISAGSYPIPSPTTPSSYYPIFNDVGDVLSAGTTIQRSPLQVWDIFYNSLEDASAHHLTLNSGDAIVLRLAYTEFSNSLAQQGGMPDTFPQVLSCFGIDVLGTFNWVSAFPCAACKKRV